MKRLWLDVLGCKPKNLPAFARANRAFALASNAADFLAYRYPSADVAAIEQALIDYRSTRQYRAAVRRGGWTYTIDLKRHAPIAADAKTAAQAEAERLNER